MNKIKLKHKKRTRQLILIIPLILLMASGSAFTEDIPLMKIQEITDLIMSPGCNYIYTLSFCPSAEAEQMRELVKDKLMNGETKGQILAYFEKVYGPKILAQPAKKGFYFFAWWFPYFLLIDAIVLVGVVLYIWRRRAQKRDEKSVHELSEDNKIDAELDALLEDEVKKFREG